MTADRWLIEDDLPIEAVSAEASREKSARKGHISILHLRWARRPLVACRAAVYEALVPASRFVPDGASDKKKKSLGRANAAKFEERLCKYPGDPKVIAEAQRHIFEALVERLTRSYFEGNNLKLGLIPTSPTSTRRSSELPPSTHDDLPRDCRTLTAVADMLARRSPTGTPRFCSARWVDIIGSSCSRPSVNQAISAQGPLCEPIRDRLRAIQAAVRPLRATAVRAG